MIKGILRLDDETDLKILKFIWRWKVSTTAGIATAICPSRSTNGVYRRLLKLEKGGFIRVQATNNGKGFVWLLEQKGFHTIKGLLLPLSSLGYKSEHLGHDLISHAIHLGDWISGTPEGTDLFTEQELRHIDEQFYPTWVPRTPMHRPDGWWLVTADKPLKIALEVELSLKDPENYESLGEYYGNNVPVDRVIWLVNGPTETIYIHRRLVSGQQSEANVHSMVHLGEFLRVGWQCSIRRGRDEGKTLREILDPKAVPLLSQGTGMVLCDVRKKPVKTKTLASPSASIFLY